MTRQVAERLALPVAMASIMLLALAYWWLDNLPHELAGTAMFVFLARHVLINRSWFRQLPRGRYDARRMLVLVLHAVLMINMAVLLATSLAISNALFAFLSLPPSPFLREVHWFSAYWVVVIVGIHLGTHWHRVMALAAPILGVFPARLRAIFLRLLAFGGAAYGLWSFGALGVGSKLTFTYSLDFWDFTTSVFPFLAHWTGVLCLFGVATHYALAAVKAFRLKAARGAQPTLNSTINPRSNAHERSQ